MSAENRNAEKREPTYQGSFCFDCQEVLIDNLEIMEHEAAEHTVLEYWS
jgi:hypothetical protein